MINYLINFCRLDPWAKDKNGDTFFHLLCQNKKVEAMGYCLKNQLLSGISIKDLRNDNRKNLFDLSLDNSTAEIPFLLLSVTEFSSLLPTDSSADLQSGDTVSSSKQGTADDDAKETTHESIDTGFVPHPRFPSDPRRLIASKAKSNPSFAQLESSIVFHQRIGKFVRRFESRPLLGPYPAYALLLLKPFLLPPLLFLFCRSMVGPWIGYEGGIFYLIAFYFAWSYKSENYRMNHVSKWPNPFMAALFFSGIFYDFVIFYGAIRPAMKTTLTSSSSWGFCFDVFVIATTLTLTYQYLALMLGDPGRARACPWLSDRSPGRGKDCDEPEEKSALILNEKAAGDAFINDHCALCRVRTDVGAHVRHCRLCDVCMRGFDHHCLFLLTCVAEKNRRLFLAFLIFVDLICIPTLLICICHHFSASFVSTSEELTIIGLLLDLLSSSLSDSYLAMLIFLCLGNLIAWSWIAYLIYYQIYYVVRAHTTSCVGIKSCRDELNRKITWKQFSTSLVYFLTKGQMLKRNVGWA